MTEEDAVTRNKHWGILGGRRFVLSVLTLATISGLLVGGYISAEIFRDLTLATVAVYIAAAGVQKYGEQKVKVAEIKADAEIDVAEVSNGNP